MKTLRHIALCLVCCLVALPATANYWNAEDAAFANVAPTLVPDDDLYGFYGGWSMHAPATPVAALGDTENVGTTGAAHFKFTGLIPGIPHDVHTYAMYVKDMNYSYGSVASANSDLAAFWDSGNGTPFGYQSWHELADVTPDGSGTVDLYLGNRPTPGGAGGLARFELNPANPVWGTIFEVESVIVNPGVLGTASNPSDNLYSIEPAAWGGYTWLAMHDSETIAEANVPHLQLTGLQPNHWYAMRFHEAWLGQASYSFSSAAAANSDWLSINRLNTGNFDDLQNMSSAQADASGNIDIYLGDFVSSVNNNFAGWDYIQVWDSGVIPEPSTAALFLLGSLLWLRRRR